MSIGGASMPGALAVFAANPKTLSRAVRGFFIMTPSSRHRASLPSDD
jgi:hypothetical protein